MEDEARNKTKLIRFTQKEIEHIEKEAQRQNKTFSEYARKMMLKKISANSENKQLLSNLITEINYIGHNINQIVKNNNSELYKKSDKERLSEQMRLIYQKLDEVIARYGG